MSAIINPDCKEASSFTPREAGQLILLQLLLASEAIVKGRIFHLFIIYPAIRHIP